MDSQDVRLVRGGGWGQGSVRPPEPVRSGFGQAVVEAWNSPSLDLAKSTQLARQEWSQRRSEKSMVDVSHVALTRIYCDLIWQHVTA